MLLKPIFGDLLSITGETSPRVVLRQPLKTNKNAKITATRKEENILTRTMSLKKSFCLERNRMKNETNGNSFKWPRFLPISREGVQKLNLLALKIKKG